MDELLRNLRLRDFAGLAVYFYRSEDGNNAARAPTGAVSASDGSFFRLVSRRATGARRFLSASVMAISRITSIAKPNNGSFV